MTGYNRIKAYENVCDLLKRKLRDLTMYMRVKINLELGATCSIVVGIDGTLHAFVSK